MDNTRTPVVLRKRVLTAKTAAEVLALLPDALADHPELGEAAA
jgi:hypothetical protein